MKKNRLENRLRKFPNQPKLTYQTSDLGHVIRITLEKKIKNYKIQFTINQILNDKILKK